MRLYISDKVDDLSTAKFTLKESIGLNTHGSGSKYADEECAVFLLDKNSHVTDLKLFQPLAGGAIKGMIFEMSDGDTEAYGDVSGQSSDTYSFTD